MIVFTHLYPQSKPVVIGGAINAYTKDGLYCVMVPRAEGNPDGGIVHVHLYSQSQPCSFGNVRNTYTKDGLYCVWTTARADGTPEIAVYKFPVQHIFRIKEFGDDEVVHKFPVQHIFRIKEIDA